MDIGTAVAALKAGKRVHRKGWNGKDMWLVLSPGCQALPAESFWAGANRRYAEQNGGAAEVLPSISMKNASGGIQMGWVASQPDLLAEDWEVLED